MRLLAGIGFSLLSCGAGGVHVEGTACLLALARVAWCGCTQRILGGNVVQPSLQADYQHSAWSGT